MLMVGAIFSIVEHMKILAVLPFELTMFYPLLENFFKLFPRSNPTKKDQASNGERMTISPHHYHDPDSLAHTRLGFIRLGRKVT